MKDYRLEQQVKVPKMATLTEAVNHNGSQGTGQMDLRSVTVFVRHKTQTDIMVRMKRTDRKLASNL